MVNASLEHTAAVANQHYVVPSIASAWSAHYKLQPPKNRQEDFKASALRLEPIGSVPAVHGDCPIPKSMIPRLLEAAATQLQARTTVSWKLVQKSDPKGLGSFTTEKLRDTYRRQKQKQDRAAKLEPQPDTVD